MKVWEALPLCRAGSGTSKGRGKEGGSQQFRGSEAAWRGRQMGEQVLYLPSSNSAEQSCHQTLKGVIKAAAQPISGHCFRAFLWPQYQQSACPSPAVCCAPSPGSWCPAALRDSWSPLGHVLATCLVWWQICWQLGLSKSITTAFGCGLHPRL